MVAADVKIVSSPSWYLPRSSEPVQNPKKTDSWDGASAEHERYGGEGLERADGEATLYAIRERQHLWNSRPGTWLIVSTIGDIFDHLHANDEWYRDAPSATGRRRFYVFGISSLCISIGF